MAAGVGLIVVLAVLEGALHAFDDFGLNNPVRSPTDETEFVGRPWEPREFREPVIRNREGFRAPEFDGVTDRPFRVGVVGDSFVQASQVPMEDALWAVAERELPGVQVLPVYVGNWPFRKRVRILRETVARTFGPGAPYPALDAIVLSVRGPTVLRDDKDDWRIVMRRIGIWELGVDEVLRSVGRCGLSSASLLVTRLRTWIRFSVSPVAMTPGERLRRTKDRLQGGLETLEAFARESHVAVGCLWLPDLADVRDQTLHGGPPTGGARALFLEAAGARGDLPFADPTPSMPGPGAYFPADGHPNVLGQRRLGEVLAGLIRRLSATTGRGPR